MREGKPRLLERENTAVTDGLDVALLDERALVLAALELLVVLVLEPVRRAETTGWVDRRPIAPAVLVAPLLRFLRFAIRLPPS